MSQSYKRILIAFVGFIFLASGIFFILNSPPGDMKEDILIVEKGDTISGAATTLKKGNLISSRTFFIFLAISQDAKIIKGKYKIYEGMTANEILRRLSKGEILRRKVTIPEGFNLWEISEKLEEEDITDGDDFLYHSFDKKFLESIGIPAQSAEGYLFPDTYIFAEAKDPRDVIIIMHNKLKDVLASIDLTNLKKYNLDNNKLLNLASLIEKEAQIASERGLISSVFHRRLRKGIKLYCDPTVRYAVKKFKGRIRYKDLEYDSPYNTYRYKGLPPTPICSVGKDSIIAALNPAKSSYLYFVARNDGSHYFSKTLKEHNKAVDFYQKGINNGFVDRQR